MFSEQLAVMLFLAAAQMAPYQAKVPATPAAADARQTLIRAVKEPELVAALSLRAKRAGIRKLPVVVEGTMLARAD